MKTEGQQKLQAFIGVDVGGTFTDLVCLTNEGKAFHLKVPSTPDDPARAVMQAIESLMPGVAPEDMVGMMHGTTVATNAVLERTGARVGLITTEGFADTLEIGRQMRRQMYETRLEPQTPAFIAPGHLRHGIRERIGADGEVVTALDETDLIRALTHLSDAGVEAIAVCLLFSFRNPGHEQRVRSVIEEQFPHLSVSLSSEVDPAFREYERTAVTAFDAYLKPVVGRYLERLADSLLARGINAPLQVMQSRGGLAAGNIAARRPVRLFLSGPAAGVLGGQATGALTGDDDLITVDIGGTSCDIALISGAKPLLRAEGVIDGFAVRVPMVDVNAIGSGGGSIAWLDAADGLRVGPQSAGAMPGPACYGRGGELPTVTDASVVLGYLDPTYFAGGTMQLDPALAHEAVERHIARPLGLSIEAAAAGIHRVLNAQMAEGVRLVSIRQGFDPRRFSLLPLGGAGPLHACELADELGIRRVLVPARPGVLAATGLLNAPIEHEVSGAFGESLEGLSKEDLQAAFEALDAEARRLMAAEGVDPEQIETDYFADVCYIGQGYHLEVPLMLHSEAPIEQLYKQFLTLHDRVYGYAVDGPLRLVNLRTVHRVPAPLRSEARLAFRERSLQSRTIRLLQGGDPIDVPVWHRQMLDIGETVEGPMIVEQDDTTLLLTPSWRGTVHESGVLILQR
ncbi:MAG: hydantoinase/oxoprolinase family protein [Gammaproteobacteria bacterium]|nr:hydantoinase/oxoprolinase family protein [Gammaproteobacteria bacterium]